ncbi:MAG TPA: hypothetical protein VMH02_11230 [Verrucomicrobiae bacterium]|nr:hypothetical protein [Verrucomicrobiae bacterium]
MAVNVAEYINKIQEEGLTTLKQTQDASLAAFGEFRKLANTFAGEKPGTLPTFENIPSPTQLVELSFGFASQLLEIRKGYTLKIAEMIAESTKQAEAAVKNAVTQPNNVAPKAPAATK